MLDCFIDAILDTLKLFPFLFLTFVILECIEHKLSNKTQKKLIKYKKAGPIFGGLLGGIPECGFSAMASSLFSSRVITMGTLIAIFLSTSDEMLPVMISEKVNPLLILKIIGFKILIGMIIGLIVDLIYKTKTEKNHEHIHDLCDDEHCHCEEDGILKSSLKHTLNTIIFVFIANILINFAIYFIGEDTITKLLESKNLLVYFASSLIGLIPNCAASILITEVYISGLIPIGVTISGLLTGSGIGILLLFKSNKNIKENLSILSIIYFVGVFVGIIVDLII
jgi:hypothetical protein